MGIETVLFQPGTILITPGAADACRNARQAPQAFLKRHLSGLWGELEAEDRLANQRALISGERLLSAYHTGRAAALDHHGSGSVSDNSSFAGGVLRREARKCERPQRMKGFSRCLETGP